MKLSLVLHAHQPPGNFDSVFRRAVDTCYGPVLDLLDAHPGVRVSLHFSGPLLEWLEAQAPERIEQMQRLVDRGQAGLVTAGLYEPVLPLLPPRDRSGQLRAHRAYLERLFGRDTRVAWLTERVWEPSLVEDLVAGGIETVILDDRHLLASGLRPEALTGPYLTEYQGAPLLVAPGSERLRMIIPWEPVDEAIAEIRRQAKAGVDHAIYADDLEKWGLWPGTHRDVIQRGWLDRFFGALEGMAGEVEVVPIDEAVSALEPRGRVYVPDGSYPEMLEWSLPADGQHALQAVRELLDRKRAREAADPFLRVGLYYQFLAKYPEVNHLHKRMLDVSRRVAAKHRRLPDPPAPEALPTAQRELWMAQANCVYWHGLFGGTYLAALRHANWGHLLRAERALADEGERAAPLRVFDLDADRVDEAVLTSDRLLAVIDPAEGSVVELSDRVACVNLGDTLARRREAYHEVADNLPYDDARRALFVDRFLARGAPPARNREIEDHGDFAGRPYQMRTRRASGGDGMPSVTLSREAFAGDTRARVEKTFAVERTGRGRVRHEAFVARYRVEPVDGLLDTRFGVECNFGVYFEERPSGHVTLGDRSVSLARGGAGRALDGAAVVLDRAGGRIEIAVEPPADVDVRPVHTYSRSESGFERVPQALACLFSWPLDGDRPFEATIRITSTWQDAAPKGAAV